MNKIEKLSTIPAAFSSIGEKLNELIGANPPLKAGAGITITDSDDSRLIALDTGVISSYFNNNFRFRHPFQVYLTTSGQANILTESRVYTSLRTSSTSITNLTTAFSLSSNTYVWLQFTVSSLVITNISRQTGTAWPSLVVTSGSPAAQNQFNVPIGKVTSSNPTAPGFEFKIPGASYHFEQCLFSHLLVEDRCEGGTPILYAFPWCGAV